MMIHFKTDPAFRDFFGSKYKCYYYCHDYDCKCQYIAIYFKSLQKYELRRFIGNQKLVFLKDSGWQDSSYETTDRIAYLSWKHVIDIVTLDIL